MGDTFKNLRLGQKSATNVLLCSGHCEPAHKFLLSSNQFILAHISEETELRSISDVRYAINTFKPIAEMLNAVVHLLILARMHAGIVSLG